MNKKQLLQKFKDGVKFKVVSPSHKYFNVERKAEKVQTNAIKWSGGSWCYFSDIKAENITDNGFKISDLMGGFIEYVEVTQ